MATNDDHGTTTVEAAKARLYQLRTGIVAGRPTSAYLVALLSGLRDVMDVVQGTLDSGPAGDYDTPDGPEWNSPEAQ